MTRDEVPSGEIDISEQEFELDTDGAEEDLNEVMQEALEAVERAEEVDRQGGTDDTENSVAEIADLEAEIADLRDRSARTLADFENFRRRVERERIEDRRFAAMDVLKEFLPVIDNLERALAASGPADDLKTGVELIFKQMQELLRAAGVERLVSEGEPFDPQYHEAVSRDEDPSVESPTVSAELQAGYLLHDRLLRPAIVKVVMPAIEEEGR